VVNPATAHLYARHERRWIAWCDSRGISSLTPTPEAVADYLAELKQRTGAATVVQHRAAIRAYHLAAGVPVSASRAFCVDNVARYSLADRRKHRGKVPVNPYNLRRLLSDGDASNVLVLRNRALFVLAQRFRPNELCRIKTSHIVEATSKQVTFQFGARRVVMDGDAVTHLIEWLKAAGIVDGLLLRNMRRGGRIGEALSEDAARRILKRVLGSLGVDAARYSLNSLRKGWGMADGGQSPATVAPRMERRQPSGVPIADIAAIWGIDAEREAAA
jgi:integrase